MICEKLLLLLKEQLPLLNSIKDSNKLLCKCQFNVFVYKNRT